MKSTNNSIKQPDNPRWRIVWRNVIILTTLHLISFYGLYLWLIKCQLQLISFIFQLVWALCASFGITGGAHRLWTHRSYKANTPLKILYAIFMSMVFANDIYAWARDHRTHHKFTETNADPHNAKRGFFFSHIGWLLVKRHPDVITKGNQISYKDLEEDAVVMFHRRHYLIMMLLGTFLLPTFIPWYFWGQEYAWIFCVMRYIINIHMVWSLNSFAHLYGIKPYDRNIYATENITMMYLTIGEGFHNYHHVFPWDYKAAEFGNDGRNLTTYLIDWFAAIGWATELKTASPGMIKSRALRTGDGNWIDKTSISSIASSKNESITEESLWGWDDPDISNSTKEKTLIK